MQQAYQKYRAALELAPTNAPYWFNLGCCLSLQGQTSEAVAALEEWKKHAAQPQGRALDNDSDFDRIRDAEAFQRFRAGLA